MRQRCQNPKHKNFRFYGGRGISICPQWLGETGFQTFCRDVGQRPEGKTLDRKNNDGNYEPNNVRWATQSEQLRNKRRFS
jgi:hypothetical protein